MEAECSVMERWLDISITAIMECDYCHREVEAIHADCQDCYELAPESTPLERCDHFICRRCGEEI